MRELTKPSKDKDRLYFEAPNDEDNVLVILANQGGGLTVAVAEEFPMDSYNETFECTFFLPRDGAISLRDYLNREFP